MFDCLRRRLFDCFSFSLVIVFLFVVFVFVVSTEIESDGLKFDISKSRC